MTNPKPKREDYPRPWEHMPKATDEEMQADQRRHEDGEPWEDFDEDL